MYFSDEKFEESGRPLLSEEPYQSDPQRQKQRALGKRSFFMIVSLSLYTVVIVIATLYLKQFREASIRLGPLAWKQQRFETNVRDSSFAGEPRPDLDLAWHNLLNDDNVRLPKNYVQKQGIESIAIKNTTDVVVQLSVFHALHCLKKTRQLLYKDYYFPDADEAEIKFQYGHVDHCVEYIRESLMCSADTSVIGLHWTDKAHKAKGFVPSPSKDASFHQCIDWERLSSWASENRFNLYETEKLELVAE